MVITKCKHLVLENVKQLPPLKRKENFMIRGRIKQPSHVMSTDCHVLVKSCLLSKRTKGVLICSSLVLKSSALLVETH